jgi:hypothetical protein
MWIGGLALLGLLAAEIARNSITLTEVTDSLLDTQRPAGFFLQNPHKSRMLFDNLLTMMDRFRRILAETTALAGGFIL